MSNESHGPAKERDLVEVGEEHGYSTVDAEGPHARQGGNGPDDEGQDSGQVSDGDGHACLREGTSHTLLHREVQAELTPGGNHDEHVVNTDTYAKWTNENDWSKKSDSIIKVHF